MHTGEDTSRFLAAGFDVVAVEANPELVSAATQTFAAEIDNGRLTIVDAAIAPQRGTARLGISDMTIWSSLDPAMIARNEHVGSSYRYVEVDTVPFEEVLERFGMPWYLKIDIEGYDMLCVRALRHFADKPRYVSVESSVSTNDARAEAVFDELAELWTQGYRQFRYVNQRTSRNEAPTDAGWPGPRWRPATAALAQAQALRMHHNLVGMGGAWSRSLPARIYGRVRRQLHWSAAWYDLHAALPS